MRFSKIEHIDVKDRDQVVADMGSEIVTGTARRLEGCETATVCDEQGQLRFLKFACEVYRIQA